MTKQAKTDKASLRDAILSRIQQSGERVFMRADFSDLGNYSQIGYALGRLVKQEKLVSIGYGFYSPAEISTLSGRIVPCRGITTLGRDALQKLGFELCLTRAEIAYNEGRSTQVPTGRKIGVRTNKRITRRIAYNGARIYYERHPVA